MFLGDGLFVMYATDTIYDICLHKSNGWNNLQGIATAVQDVFDPGAIMSDATGKPLRELYSPKGLTPESYP